MATFQMPPNNYPLSNSLQYLVNATANKESSIPKLSVFPNINLKFLINFTSLGHDWIKMNYHVGLFP